MPLVPVVGLFVGVGDGEEVGFPEGLADELQADGQAARAEAAGQAQAGSAFSPALKAGVGDVGVRSASTSR